MKVRRVGIILKRGYAQSRRMAGEISQWLESRGITTLVDRIDKDLDLLLVLGGDGTLLHVAAEACEHGIPILGINLGGLGFLTEVAVDERMAILERIAADDLPVEERMMLRVRLRRGDDLTPWIYALNDVVINKGAEDRMARLGAWVDDEYLATYRSDGLIIATSTGSTAYNLSAGGPIVHPRLDAFVVTPICPFMLESRPVLLAASHTLLVEIAQAGIESPGQDRQGDEAGEGYKKATGLQVIVDGQKQFELCASESLEVVAAEKKLRLVTSPWKGYFAILRGKLNWAAGYSFSSNA